MVFVINKYINKYINNTIFTFSKYSSGTIQIKICWSVHFSWCT